MAERGLWFGLLLLAPRHGTGRGSAVVRTPPQRRHAHGRRRRHRSFDARRGRTFFSDFTALSGLINSRGVALSVSSSGTTR